MGLRLFSLLCIALLTVGCIQEQARPSGGARPVFPWGGGGGGRTSPAADESPFRGFTVNGSDQYYNADAFGPNAPEQVVVVPEGGNTVQLNLVNASIGAAAQAVLGETLGKSFIVSDNVSGSITLQTTGRVSKAALLDLFAQALAINNARMENRNGTIHIVSADGSSRAFRAVGADANAAIIVAPLHHISPSSMMNLLQPIIDDGLWVKAENAYNMILFSGSPSAINAALEALNIFDVNVMEGKSVALIPLQAAEPEAIVEELTTIFEAGEGGRLNGAIEFIPNPASRSVLIIANQSGQLNEAKAWVARLDRVARETGTYVEVYPLNYRDAAEIAPMLSALMGNPPSATNTNSENASTPQNAPELRISADVARNSIVVMARDNDHKEVRKLLAQLDTSARQVLLEATIAEVTLNDDLSLGVRWFFQNGPLSAGLSDLPSGATDASYPGFSAVFSGVNAQVALNALASVTDVQILSSPTIMVAENKSATLRIGDQVPIATQNSASGTDTTVVTTIDYRDTGVILTVTPRIGANGAVSLKIAQEVSDVVATTTSGIDSPTIRQRQVETTVSVANGATLTLGGLVQENSSRGRGGVPGAQRVPILGALFGNRNNRYRRTELLILIRPLVINNASEAARITDYWRDRLSGANGVYNAGAAPPTHVIIGSNSGG